MSLLIAHIQRVRIMMVDIKDSQLPGILSDGLSFHENPKFEGNLRKSPVLIGLYWKVSERKETFIECLM